MDPRLWALQKPKATLVLFLLLTGAFAWGNVRLQRGGMFDDDVILHVDDPFRQMDQYVQEKRHHGFDAQEVILFILNGGVRAAADLQETLHFTTAAKEQFGDSILSLAVVPAYQDTGETLRDDPYITQSALTQAGFRLQEWKAWVAADSGVFGVLVSRDFAWTAVVRYLPPEHDEIVEFRRTVEFLEDRSIPWWEWFWKRDIIPRDRSVGVGGWVMGRGLIDQGLNVDMLLLVFLGVTVTLPVFRLALGSWWVALLSVGVMVLGGFIWTRGTMGLVGMRERVFSVLAYANAVVQGTSFALHKYAALAEGDTQDRREAWQRAQAVDGVIATTAGIAVFGFATLWTFGLRPIRELGLASACGVVWLLVLAVVFLPALDLLIHGTTRTASLRSHPGPTIFDRILMRVISRCRRAAHWLAVGKRPWAMIGTICSLFALVAMLFASERIQSRTRALEFLRGTLVEQQARLLNQPGNLGFEFLDLLVEPAQGGDLYDPRFLTRAWAFQEALRTLPAARETASILGTVRQIARESLKKPFPETREEVDAAFVLIENRLAVPLQRQLYFPGGIRISVSSSMEDSVELGRFCERVLALARRDFPDLRVSAFGTVPIYPRVDQYVRWGKVANVFTSQVGIALMCALLIGWRNWRHTGRRLSPLRTGLVMSAPLLCATAVIGLVMGMLGTPLDMATASIGALAINAATDFSLYLAVVYQQTLKQGAPLPALDEALDTEGKIILADCLLNTLCFAPLLTSRFLPIQHIGWMMAVMLVTCAAASLVVMGALLPRCVIAQDARA